MTELNTTGSSSVGNATTNQTFHGFCSGLRPSKTVQITTYSISMVLSLIGNVLVLLIFYRNKTLRTAVHYFIMNMAVSDLIYPVVFLPFRISAAYLDNEWLVRGVFGNILCKIAWNAGNISNFVSTVSMVVIAVDRFHAVLFPMRPTLLSRKKCRFIIIATWLAALGFCSHLIYAVQLVSNHSKRYRCLLKWTPASQTIVVVKIFLISFLCLTIGSAVVLTVLYSTIITRLYSQKGDVNLANEVIRKRARENRRVTWMLLTVVILFYLVWTQAYIVNFAIFLKHDVILPCFYFWLGGSAFSLLQPVVNPIVYFVFNGNYRRGIKEMFKCPCTAVSFQFGSNANNMGEINYGIELSNLPNK